MASEINLTVGSLVSFTSTIAREFYEGRVYLYDPKDASFGIDDVSRTNVSGGYRRVEGCYQFSLKDIKDLRVIREPKLIVGSLVSFTLMTAGEFYQGTVYFYNSKDASFGIDDVSRTKFRSGYRRVEGYYQFYLEDIKDLRVIRVPVPKSTTNTNKDDQKTNPGTGASSSASTSK